MNWLTDYPFLWGAVIALFLAFRITNHLSKIENHLDNILAIVADATADKRNALRELRRMGN